MLGAGALLPKVFSTSLGNPDIEITVKFSSVFHHGAAMGQVFMLYMAIHRLIQKGNEDRMRVAAAVVDSNIIWRK